MVECPIEDLGAASRLPTMLHLTSVSAIAERDSVSVSGNTLGFALFTLRNLLQQRKWLATQPLKHSLMQRIRE